MIGLLAVIAGGTVAVVIEVGTPVTELDDGLGREALPGSVGALVVEAALSAFVLDWVVGSSDEPGGTDPWEDAGD